MDISRVYQLKDRLRETVGGGSAADRVAARLEIAIEVIEEILDSLEEVEDGDE